MKDNINIDLVADAKNLDVKKTIANVFRWGSHAQSSVNVTHVEIWTPIYTNSKIMRFIVILSNKNSCFTKINY